MNTHFTFSILVTLVFCLSACGPHSEEVLGVAGAAGLQTPVARDTQGNEFGYYEYLPQQFNAGQRYSLLFYWNGANTVTGDGREDLHELLDQGLPQNINSGSQYPSIIISPQVKEWKNVDIKSFVEYVLRRYQQNIDSSRVYMSGFSAGGGITMRFARAFPGIIAAIVPIAPAMYFPEKKGPTPAMAEVPSWIFHNNGDVIVEVERSVLWHEALKTLGGDHRLTVYAEDSHYAWQRAYDEARMWAWLITQKKGE